ncbi:MAG: hypothetical protein QMC23_07605 [Rubritalea sp.]|tara:strand:- start:648 stop:2036 length:1389 start_codon:yes stop_codon:yes gene_type:complete
MSKKLTIEEMRAIAKEWGGRCLSDTYVNATTKLKWQCSEEHVWAAAPSVIKSGRWCPLCRKKKATHANTKYSIADMRKLAEKKGGECLSTVYTSTVNKLKWKCSESHEWEAIPKNMLLKGTWCPFCAGKAPRAISEMQTIAEERGGECLSKTCTHIHKKLRWRCSEGHEFEAAPAHVIHSGSWCRICATGRGESFCRLAFETIFGGRFPNIRPVWLISSRGTKLELDGLNSEIGLAFEHQGKQHYEPKDFHTEGSSKESKDALQRTKNNDMGKMVLCIKKGVALILVPEVPSLTKLDNLKSTIGLLCKKAGYPLPENFEYIKIDYSMAYANPSIMNSFEELCQIAAERGGKLISTYFKGSGEQHKWQCEKGHQWMAKPLNVKHRESWCPVCSLKKRAEKRRGTIEDMQAIAEARGGKCLSDTYINSINILKWQCAKGHTWLARPANVKRATWCPYCAGKRKL